MPTGRSVPPRLAPPFLESDVDIERLRALEKLDEAFEAEIRRVSTVQYNSNEICRHFFGQLRAKYEALIAELGQEVGAVAWQWRWLGDSDEGPGPWNLCDNEAHSKLIAANSGYEVRPLYTSPAHTSEARDADINDLALEQGPDDIPRLTLAGRELAAFPAGTIDKVMDTLSFLGGHCVGDSERLDFMDLHRVALVPEFEGPWDVEVYEDGQMTGVFSGSDTRSALDAAIAAMRQEGE